VTKVDSGTSAVSVAISTTAVDNAGFILPASADSIGHQIRFLSTATKLYTIWAPSGETVDGSATRSAASGLTLCTCMTTNVWQCSDFNPGSSVSLASVTVTSSKPSLSIAVGAYSIVSSATTTDGVALPTPFVGATIKLYRPTTSTGVYTIYTSATTIFINAESTITSYSVSSGTYVVTCTGVSTTSWHCNNGGNFKRPVEMITSTAISPQASQSGTMFVSDKNGACTVTLPLCDAAAQGSFFRFMFNDKSVSLTFTASGSDKMTMWYNYYDLGYYFYSGSVATYTFTTGKYNFGDVNTMGKGNVEGYTITLECGVVGYWRFEAVRSTTTDL
jgi:hypothetical protein